FLVRRLDLIQRLVIVVTHDIAAHDRGSVAYARPDTGEAVFHPGSIDDAAFRNDRFLQRGAADLGRRQHPGAGINSPVVVEKIELGKIFRKPEVSFEKRIDMPYIRPVTIVLEA